MTSQGIPPETQELARRMVEHFNRVHSRGSVRHVVRFKGAYLYLDRDDMGSDPVKIGRLRYGGSMDKWKFAILKHSSNRCDDEPFLLPAAGFLDGRILGALRCGMEAYPT